MFRGSIAALITPLNSDLEIDFQTFTNLIEWHIQEGTDALVICGTTGEDPTLSNEEKNLLIRCAVAVGKGKIPIIAGTGSYNTKEAVRRTEEAQALGVDACLVIIPYYNRPTAEGCIAHFREISKVGLPIILYHHPGRAGIKLSCKTLLEIVKMPNIIGIKEASGDLDLALELTTESTTSLFCGDDTLLFPYLSVGAVGVISIIANLIPNEWKKVVTSRDLQLMKQYYSLCKAMVLETNPQCIKYAMSLIGKCQSDLRLPLLIPQEENRRVIEKCVQEALYDRVNF